MSLIVELRQSCPFTKVFINYLAPWTTLTITSGRIRLYYPLMMLFLELEIFLRSSSVFLKNKETEEINKNKFYTATLYYAPNFPVSLKTT